METFLDKILSLGYSLLILSITCGYIVMVVNKLINTKEFNEKVKK